MSGKFLFCIFNAHFKYSIYSLLSKYFYFCARRVRGAFLQLAAQAAVNNSLLAASYYNSLNQQADLSCKKSLK